MKKVLLSIALIVCFCASCWGAPRLTADDFMPVIQAESEKQREELLTVQHPEEVKTEVDPLTKIETTSGKSLKDAINYLIKPYERRGVKAIRTGVRRASDPTGYSALVSTGLGSYNKNLRDTNINAARISQRNAYLIALIDAKNQLVETLKGVNVSGKDIFSNEDTTSNTSANASSGGAVAVNQSARVDTKGILKGYVTYSTFDDGVSNVYVTIVITPKTMQATQRPDEDNLIFNNLRDGITTALAEIQSGLVPPVGGRTITVPKTGEMGLVAFGSAIIQRADTPMAIAMQERNAEKIAKMRAQSELCAILAGDQVDGHKSYQESVIQAFGNSAQKTKEKDPMNQMTDESDFALVNSVKDEFMHNRQFNEAISNARHGVIPQGVNIISWTDDEGAWAYAVAVYIPSESNRAATDARTMEESQLIRPIQTEQDRQKAQEAIKKQQEQERLVKGSLNNDSGELKQGVSGTISQDL